MDKPWWRPSKRVVLTFTALVAATGLLWCGKLDGTNWVYALGLILGTHHAGDITDRIRK